MSRSPLIERAAKDSASPSFAYVDLFRAEPVQRIAVIKAGVPAGKIKSLSGELRVDQTVMLKALGLKTATVNRKAAQHGALSMEDGERVLGLAKLVGQVEAMVEESELKESGGRGGFDARVWLSRWLREALPALGGAKPIDFLDTMEGQAVVSRALAQVQTGAYA